MADWRWLIAWVSLGALLLWLFWHFRKKRLRTPGPLPHSFFATVGNFKVHFQQLGAGPSLILVHGIGASNYIWRYMVDDLSQDYRITAIDLPGFGRSDKLIQEKYDLDHQVDRLKNFIEAQKLGPAVFVGSSMGGAICLWLGLKHPHLVKKLIVLAPATDPRLVRPLFKGFIPLLPQLQKVLSARTMKLILQFVVARRDRITDEVIQQYLEPYQDLNSIHAFKNAIEILKDPRLPHELAELQIPTLILWGKKDRLVPSRPMKELEKTLPHSELVVHPKAGHHIMEDEPEWTQEQIRKFIE